MSRKYDNKRAKKLNEKKRHNNGYYKAKSGSNNILAEVTDIPFVINSGCLSCLVNFVADNTLWNFPWNPKGIVINARDKKNFYVHSIMSREDDKCVASYIDMFNITVRDNDIKEEALYMFDYSQQTYPCLFVLYFDDNVTLGLFLAWDENDKLTCLFCKDFTNKDIVVVGDDFVDNPCDVKEGGEAA